MAPLGVLTAIVGAIRVGGADWLKRLVGRARETTAGAEIELMSSVSHEVCEAWNGTSIVRTMGNTQVKQIIHLPADEGDFSPESFITMDPKTWSKGYELEDRDSSDKINGSENFSTNLPEQPSRQPMVVRVSENADSGTTENNHDPESLQSEDADSGTMDNSHDLEPLHPEATVRPLEFQEMPPNISLNIHGGSDPVELAIYAFIATILQVAVLGWSAYAHRHKLTGSNPSVGFPLQAAGTVLLTLSLVLCAGIIDNGSYERHWSIKGGVPIGTMSELPGSPEFKFQTLTNKLRLAKEKPSRRMQFYWIQKQHIAGDNSFNPHILYAEELKDKVHESHRAEVNCQKDRDDKSLKREPISLLLKKYLRLLGRHITTFAVVIGVAGFVAQFQGLRFSDWTCSIAQLIALGMATILRAWVRRSMTKTPVAVAVDNNDYILDHLTLAIVDRGRSDSKFPNPEGFRSRGLFFAFGVTTYPKFRAVPESEYEHQVQQESEHLDQGRFRSSGFPGVDRGLDHRDIKEKIRILEFRRERQVRRRKENLDSNRPKFTYEDAETRANVRTRVAITGSYDNTSLFRSDLDIRLRSESSSPASLESTDSSSESGDEVQPRSGHSNQANIEPADPGSQCSTNLRGSKEAGKKPNLAQQALNLRVRLGRITKWPGAKSDEAIVLSNSIETALERLSPKLPAEFGDEWPVILQIDTYRTMPYMPSTSMPDSREEVELYIIKDGDKWKVDDGQLEALLSLVSYSAWAAEQNKIKQEGTDRGKSLSRSKSSGRLIKESSVEESRSVGWLRAKAPDSQIYDQVFHKSTPKLMYDLRWWNPEGQQVLKEERTIRTCIATRVLTDSTNSLSDAEAKCDKVERPALGFFVGEETSGEYRMVSIKHLLWRALTCLDTFCFWECKERQVFILHLFSTFIWAIAPYLLASEFRTTAVRTVRYHGRNGRPMLEGVRVNDDKIETLVQELQSIELGTLEEIYRVLIPPLSHHNILPNEVVADWCNARLIQQEVSLHWKDTFRGYLELLNMVHWREAQDRFANRAAAILVEFLLRLTEDPKPFRLEDRKHHRRFKVQLRNLIRHQHLLKAILSLKDILARRWGLPKDGRAGLTLRRLGLKDLLVETRLRHLPLEELCRSDDILREADFSFPNNTDIFG